jgi:type IV pilus assembly protein PilO
MVDYDLKNFAEFPIKIKLFFMLVPIIIIFYLEYLWDYSVSVKQVNRTKQQQQDLKAQLEGLLDKNMDLNNELSQLTALKQAIQDWQGKLVKPNGVSDLLNDVIKAGTANQLQFDLFSPAPPVKEGDYSKVIINTTVSGSYNQIAVFFSQLANLPMLIEIDNFTISKAQVTPDKTGSTSGSQLLSAKMVLNIYSVAEQATGEAKK